MQYYHYHATYCATIDGTAELHLIRRGTTHNYFSCNQIRKFSIFIIVPNTLYSCSTVVIAGVGVVELAVAGVGFVELAVAGVGDVELLVVCINDGDDNPSSLSTSVMFT